MIGFDRVHALDGDEPVRRFQTDNATASSRHTDGAGSVRSKSHIRHSTRHCDSGSARGTPWNQAAQQTERVSGRPKIIIQAGRRGREFGHVRFTDDVHVPLPCDRQAWSILLGRRTSRGKILRAGRRDHALHIDVILDRQLELVTAGLCRPMDDKGPIPIEEGIDTRHNRATAKGQERSQRQQDGPIAGPDEGFHKFEK